MFNWAPCSCRDKLIVSWTPNRQAKNTFTYHNAINLLQPGVAFLYLLKTSEKHRFSDVFRGYRKATRGCNGLKSKWICFVIFLLCSCIIKYAITCLNIRNNRFNNRNTRTRCEICSKLSALIVNFEHFSHFVLVFLLLTLSR